MSRFKAMRNTMALLLFVALLVIGEEKSILDGAGVICSYGTCSSSWATDAMISSGFRQMTIQYHSGADKELIIDLKQSYIVKTVYLSNYVDISVYNTIYRVGETEIYIGNSSTAGSS